MTLRMASLFDGSGGFPLAAKLEGISPMWSSEIEPFPIRVTTKRLPEVKHYGDVSEVDGSEVEPVDIITFGSPCQDMSVAGKRAGLHGSRSNLFYQAIRIIREMRIKTNGAYPRYIIWENVPGAFSSNRGEDFRCVLESICQIKDDWVAVPRSRKWESAGEIMGDDYSVAWRVLDAQYWGVPQRRKRIFLVADLADRGGAGEVLFKCESMPRNSQESEEQKQETSRIIGNCTDDAVRVYENHTQDCRYRELGNVCSTLATNLGTGGNNQPLVVKKVYRICSQDSNAMKSANPNSGIYQTEVSATIDTSNQSPCKNQGGIVVIEGNGIRPSHMGDGYKECETMYTLNTIERHGVAYGLDRASFNQGQNAKYDFTILPNIEPTMTARGPNAVAFSNVHRSLCAADGPKGISGQMMNEPEENFVALPVYSSSKDSHFTSALKEKTHCLYASDYKEPQLINVQYIVRRLTPTECARLQGFPDWWCDDLGTEEPTADDVNFWREVFETHRKVLGTSGKAKSDSQIIRWLKNPHSDSAEYKMWGNGVALPCVRYIMHNIAERHQEEEWHRQVMEEMTIQQLMEQEPELFEV